MQFLNSKNTDRVTRVLVILLSATAIILSLKAIAAGDDPLFLPQSMKALILIIFIVLPSAALIGIAIKGSRGLLAYSFVLCLAMVCILELGLRFAHKDPFNSSVHHFPRPYVGFAGKPYGKFENDHRMAGSGKKHTTYDSLDSYGFRGIIKSRNPESEKMVYRIFVIGGSTVFNGVPASNSIPGVLDALLDSAGYDNFEVYNMGVVSFTSGQELALLTHFILDREPNLVVVYDGGNDVIQNCYYDPRPGYPYNFMVQEKALDLFKGRANPLVLIPVILNKSRLLSMFFHETILDLSLDLKALRRREGFATPLWEQSIADAYLANIKKMSQVAKGGGFNIAFFLQPIVNFKEPKTAIEAALESSSGHSDYFDRQYARLRSFFANKGSFENSHLFDLTQAFVGNENQIYWDAIHTNNAGNWILGAAIFDTLVNKGLVPPHP